MSHSLWSIVYGPIYGPQIISCTLVIKPGNNSENLANLNGNKLNELHTFSHSIQDPIIRCPQCHSVKLMRNTTREIVIILVRCHHMMINMKYNAHFDSSSRTSNMTDSTCTISPFIYRQTHLPEISIVKFYAEKKYKNIIVMLSNYLAESEYRNYSI